MESVDILAIGPHPDDVELTCSGTLLRMVSQGYKVGILDLTRGEMGTLGTPESRAIEAQAASRLIGARFRKGLDLGDSQLTDSINNRLEIAQVIRDSSPKTVILPYWEGRHPDHYISAKLGYEACYISGLKKTDISGKPHRPNKILYSTIYWNAPPSFVVDISPFFEKKLEAINCFTSQFQGEMTEIAEVFPGWVKLIDGIKAQCRSYGAQIGVEYGEPFVVKETFALDDIVDLKPPSI